MPGEYRRLGPHSMVVRQEILVGDASAASLEGVGVGEHLVGEAAEPGADARHEVVAPGVLDDDAAGGGGGGGRRRCAADDVVDVAEGEMAAAGMVSRRRWGSASPCCASWESCGSSDGSRCRRRSTRPTRTSRCRGAPAGGRGRRRAGRRRTCSSCCCCPSCAGC